MLFNPHSDGEHPAIMYGQEFTHEISALDFVFARSHHLNLLEQALPGLKLSLSLARTSEALRNVSSNGSKTPLTRNTDPYLFNPKQSETANNHSNGNSEWLDAPEVEFSESESEWPDWSRWSRRTQSSSSTLSTASTLSNSYAIDCPSISPESSYSDNVNDVALEIQPSSLASDRRYSFSAALIERLNLAKSAQMEKRFKEVPLPASMDYQLPTQAKPAKPLPILESRNEVSNSYKPNALHPAKTGFALWVGNLGPRTTLADLCGLFGTPNLQSIYLIQRTGCAFVNYTDKGSLDYGVATFKKRGGQLHDHELVYKTQCNDEEALINTEQATSQPSASTNSATRYFICKSLTVEDLENAKRTGQWATQIRNMERFNQAFENSERTYLVFSANRTSAFYGIATLDSKFVDQDISDVPNKHIAIENSSMPEITLTTSYFHPHDGILVPAGETVLDPLRGSQFWKVSGCKCVEPEVEKWTAPAKITWVSSADSVVPFSRTKQLKNSLNGNKPIKVARDGTEIDPTVGLQLCEMFDHK